MSETSGDLNERHLEEIVEERASDIRWTKTAFFKMANIMKWFTIGLNLLLLMVTGVLAAAISQGFLNTDTQLLLAGVATTLSLVDLTFDIDSISSEFTTTGERYNSLLKEFEEYYRLTLLDGSIPIDEKKSKLRSLTARHRDLNEDTPPTWDIIFNIISEDDLGGTVDFTEIRG